MIVRELVAKFGIETDGRGVKKAEKGMNRLSDAAKKLGAVLSVGLLAAGFKKIIELGSDIEETANKFGAVFGDAGDAVTEQLNEIATRTGATNFQLQDMTSNIGALIKPALGSAEAAGEMAASVSELALDISSFNNVTAEDALGAIRSGLIGSAEPLQRFGVDVRVAALEQEALAQGIRKSVKDMKEGERVALRYAAIQRQLGIQGATGDATRTAEDFANASRNLGLAIKETAGIIGTFFLGGVGDSINQIRKLVNQFQFWLKVNQEFLKQRVGEVISGIARVVGRLLTVIWRVSNAVIDWAQSLDPLSQGILKVTLGIAALAAVLLLPAGSILLLIGLIGLIIDDFETWREGGESVIGDLDEALGGFLTAVRDGEVDILNFGVAFDFWKQKGGEAVDWIWEKIKIAAADWPKIIGSALTSMHESFVWLIDEALKGWGTLFKSIFWEIPVKWMNQLVGFLDKKISEAPVIGSLLKGIGGVAGAAGALAGGGGLGGAVGALQAGLGGGGTAMAVGGSRSIVNAPLRVETTINAPPGTSPEALGDIFEEKANAVVERHLRGAGEAITQAKPSVI